MNVSTRQLQAFLALARLRSFTRAAEEVFLTQAGMSLMLKDLETKVAPGCSTAPHGLFNSRRRVSRCNPPCAA
jgi:hypothetical protein